MLRVPALFAPLAFLTVSLVACGEDPRAPILPANVPAVLRKGSVPSPVDWGREPCASCEMPLVHREYGAQCLDPDGFIHVFDDPGCLVVEMGMGRLVPSAIHFKHRDEDRWLPLAETGFVRDEHTPMSFGFAAVELAQGELTFAQMRDELAARLELRDFPRSER